MGFYEDWKEIVNVSDMSESDARINALSVRTLDLVQLYLYGGYCTKCGHKSSEGIDTKPLASILARLDQAAHGKSDESAEQRLADIQSALDVFYVWTMEL
jgi:hypothetical protein